MKINGQIIPTRGSNKVHHRLDDLDKLFKRLQKKSIAAVAKDLGVPRQSIGFRVEKYFPDAWKLLIVRERKHIPKP